MKHRLLKLGLLLLFGAIINIAVAWGFMLFGNNVGSEYVTLDARDSRAPTGFVKVQILQTGWPLYCLAGEATYGVPHYGVPVLGSRIASHGTLFFEGPNAWLFPYRFGFLPIDPIWLAFTINTALYTLITWLTTHLFIAISSAIRRSRRIKRGLCPACAYPVGSGDVCTECGKPVRITTA